MNRTSFLLSLALVSAAGAGAWAVLRQEGMPPPPKPAPEHGLLKRCVGTWDATVSMMGQDGKPHTSPATMTYKAVGDYFIVGDYEGDFMGQPFRGHSIAGYSLEKKKLVTIWVDTAGAELNIGEGSYDPATKSSKSVMSGGGMTMSDVTSYPDDNTIISKMGMIGPDGKEAPWMTIEYKRRIGAKAAGAR
jgi:hypothetical protein